MDRPEPEPDRSNRGSLIIAAAMVAAAMIISWGMSGSSPRYQVASSGDAVVRMDTDSGELIACTASGCAQVEPPDRARTFGPLTVRFGTAGQRQKEALPQASNSKSAEPASNTR
jgi:hypothetical protein